MRRGVATLVLLSGMALGQNQPATSQDVAKLAQAVAQLKAIIERQEAEIAELRKAQEPPHHSKPVRVLLKALPIIDHAGSVASITGLSIKSH